MQFNASVLLLLSAITVLVTGIVTQDKATAKYRTPSKARPTQNKSPCNRQAAQKCDLICPGVPPFSLPPNFIHNCSSASNNSTQNNGSSHSTSKPKTTTASSEESEETTEESVEETTKNATARQKSRRHKKIKNKNHRSHKGKQESKQHKQHQNKHKKHVRKEKILLRGQVKKEILKEKHFKGRSRLDGCYVVCTEGNEPSRPGNGGNEGEYGSEGPDQNEPNSGDSDDYVPGEDTPVEIYYFVDKGQQRPVDLYPHNYAFVEPQPPFGYGYDFGYDPFLWEGKQQKTKKRTEKRKKSLKERKDKI